MAERKWCASVDGTFAGKIHQILLDDFNMQMSLKAVNYGGKPRFWRQTVLQKKLSFGVSFGHHNNTRPKFNITLYFASIMS